MSSSTPLPLDSLILVSTAHHVHLSANASSPSGRPHLIFSAIAHTPKLSPTEMSKLFPSIPLVAEEDSAFVRENNLVDAVVEVVSDKTIIGDKELSQDDVLKAIDRGGKDAYLFGPEPATYWILDPIDGTRGFVKGSEALYVVGLALIVGGEIVLGVMGCPNWQDEHSDEFNKVQGDAGTVSRSGTIMIPCWLWNMENKIVGSTNWKYQNGS
ncbi:UNVERIFIED_CONTAM: putative PAP-specific phosphatase, mitochondrial [Sesamum radiatum]|uniref:PAP-specific phosphatase, mitochondrial n=1 Tax=Sesamum radiatum TaxID=300843 RepID=A0AAW2KH93_SESRA